MFLTFKEMQRAKAKFGLLTSAVALLVFLILVQQALANALVLSFNGALLQQRAPILVYATDALAAPQGSVITPAMAKAVQDSDAVRKAGRIGILGVTLPSTAKTPDAEVTATLWGYEDAEVGGPASVVEGVLPAGQGEAVGSNSEFSLGETVTVPVAGGERTLRIVGLTADSQLSVTPTLAMPWTEFEATAKAVNPSARAVLPSLMGVQPSQSDAGTLAALEAASPDLDPMTRADAAARFPGAGQVLQSFWIILGLFGFVVPLVTGLFFLIITFQKSRALTLLRAIGARGRVLVGSVLLQIMLVLAGGIGLGVGLYALSTLIKVGSLALEFNWLAVAGWSAVLIALGLLSGLGAVRRVQDIDPLEATHGGGH